MRGGAAGPGGADELQGLGAPPRLHPSLGSAAMPKMEVVRVDSEERLLLALVSALKSPPEVQPTSLSIVEAIRATLPYLVHLLSRGPKEDLFCQDNRPYLFGLGAHIFGMANGDRPNETVRRVQSIIKSYSSRSALGAANYFSPRVAYCSGEYSAPQELQLANKLVVTDDLPLDFFNIRYAIREGAWNAAAVGLLCAKVSATGFGPREQEALRLLGGSPEVFLEALQASSTDPERHREPAMIDFSLRDLTNSTARLTGLPNFSGAYWGHLFPPRLTFSERVFTGAGNPGSGVSGITAESFDYSSRFDGLTLKQVEQLLRDCASKELIIDQLTVRHNRMMEGPPASGERRILSGTGIWASTIRENLPDLHNLHHLDLSNLDLRQSCLSGKGMSRGRFEGSNLSGANCRGTDFGGSRFGTANLADAFIAGADFRGADLSEANLSGVRWDYLIDRDGVELEAAEAPAIDRTTRVLPASWDHTYNPDPGEIEIQARRFEGWTAHQFKIVEERVGPLQRMALKRLERSLGRRKQNSLILPQSDPLASAGEFVPDVLVGGINSAELTNALTRLSARAESAHLPLIKGTHRNADLSDQERYPLRGGFVEEASLVDATMRNQDLEGVVIRNSDLSGIDLRGADLTDAYLVNVDLRSADLRGVNLTRTVFVNCNLDGIKLDQVTMIDTQMRLCTMANVTIKEGVIHDLLVDQSYLENINFAGSFRGNGLIVHGVGFVHSILNNGQFSGNTTVRDIELSGSFGLGSGPGILDSAELIVPQGSYWRDQVIQRFADQDLGEISSEVMIERVEGRRGAHQPSIRSFLLQELISSERVGNLGSVALLEHLSEMDIGFRGDEVVTGNRHSDLQNHLVWSSHP